MLEFEKNDEIFIGDKILKEFGNCLECGLCCRFFDVLPVFKQEIDEISKYLHLTQREFIEKFTRQQSNKKHNCEYSLKTPCPFQKQNECLIYEKRGFICQTFPFCMNLTKNTAVLSGIYLCPQATQFYEGFLDFCKNYDPESYQRLIEKERHVTIDKDGMKIQGSSMIFSPYLDWLYSRED